MGKEMSFGGDGDGGGFADDPGDGLPSDLVEDGDGLQVGFGEGPDREAEDDDAEGEDRRRRF